MIREEQIGFYESLRFQLLFGSRHGDWDQMKLNGAEIVLLTHPPSKDDERIEIIIHSDIPLPGVERDLVSSGVNSVMSATRGSASC